MPTRDMDLIRKVLFAIEEHDYTSRYFKDFEVPGHGEKDVQYHVALLQEAGFVLAANLGNGGGRAGESWYPIRLTWKGHEFLDAARDEGRWQLVVELATGLSFELLWEMLKEKVKEGL